jgi:hypothetical protein
MTDMNATPPRLAQWVAGVFVPAREIDSVTGDLLEEYREVQLGERGKRHADLWYFAQVLSLAGRVIWPGLLAIVALRLLTFPLPGRTIPSLVPSPGTSLLDAVVLIWIGYHAAARTGQSITGILAASATGVLGFGSFFVYAIATQPSLLLAPVRTPFVVVIFCVLLLIAVLFAVVAGAAGAAAGRWRHSIQQKAA